MKFFGRLELEHKILIGAVFFFAVLGMFFSRIYEKEIDFVLDKGKNERLTEFMRKKADNRLDSAVQEKIRKLFERQLQWEAAAPFVAKTQINNSRTVLFIFTVSVLFAAFFSLLYITSPLKKLAKSVEKIGKGEYAEIEIKSGGALGVLEDKIFRLQNELIDLREKEKIAAVESAWRDIAKFMAHEIKNPLTPMRLGVDKLSERIDGENGISDAELKNFVKKINLQINNFEDLVNKFRSFSDVQKANRRVENLRPLIENCAGDMAGEIKSQINGDAFALLDRAFFAQILLNLYKNSINAGADAMKIDIEKVKNRVKISFTDNGKGVEKEKLESLFLPYVTFSQNGSGIGLAVVKNLVESMDGKVCAEAPKDGGLRIAVELESE